MQHKVNNEEEVKHQSRPFVQQFAHLIHRFGAFPTSSRCVKNNEKGALSIKLNGNSNETSSDGMFAFKNQACIEQRAYCD